MATKIRRRTWLGGIGIGVAGVGAGLLYRAAPFFWNEWARELVEPVEAAPHRPDPRAWPDKGLHAAWLGHSTVLLKIDGYTVLTDPVLATRIGLGFGPMTLGLKRLVYPALRVDELPKLDLILLSHAHMDHFDLPTLRALESSSVPVVTASKTSDLLRVEKYAGVQEVGWGETVHSGPLTIQGLRVNHWGARMRSDVWRGYNAYLIGNGRWRVLFGGDTAIQDHFRGLGGAHLAIMPIGAYDPWIRVHCSPEEAWTMSNDARAEFVLPIHHGTFHLSREPVAEPLHRLLDAAGNSQDRVALREIGQEFHLG